MTAGRRHRRASEPDSGAPTTPPHRQEGSLSGLAQWSTLCHWGVPDRLSRSRVFLVAMLPCTPNDGIVDYHSNRSAPWQPAKGLVARSLRRVSATNISVPGLAKGPAPPRFARRPRPTKKKARASMFWARPFSAQQRRPSPRLRPERTVGGHYAVATPGAVGGRKAHPVAHTVPQAEEEEGTTRPPARCGTRPFASRDGRRYISWAERF